MENINVHRLPWYSFAVSRLPWRVFSIAECLNPCPFQIDVTVLLYNIECIRKARTIHKTLSFIVLSCKQLKYEIKHENCGQIYWFLVKKIEIFSSRHNYRLLNWSPSTKFPEVHLWTYLKFMLCSSSLSTLSFCWKGKFYRHTVKGGRNYWPMFIDCRLPFRSAAYPVRI